jgi:poly(3-hydroxybutyrate) depolymerase
MNLLLSFSDASVKKRLKRSLLCLFLLIAGVLLNPVGSNAQTTTINVGGQNRSMLVYAPSNLPQNRPLVISMHGLNQDINYQKNQAKWELVADTAKFVVVYPAGVNNSWDISGKRDTDFILAIIESMVTRFGIDRNRVYVSGFSMGGMMSYHVANTIADKVAAIGPVSGYLFSNVTASSRPMPIIHVHGTSDDVVYYQASGNQQGVAAMLQKWRNWNQCPSTGTRVTPYPANKPNSKSVMEYWGPCNNSAVSLITLDGKGHWHSNDDAGVHTTIELWNFFRKFSLKAGPSISLSTQPADAQYSAPATINLIATATTPNGSITNVKFYNGNTLLATDDTAPYTYTLTDVAVGTYTFRAVLTDDKNETAEASITIKVNVPQGPYNNVLHAIPGTIQSEHFDVGGNGIAYMDSSPGSETAVAFRSDEDVDIENCTDDGGGYNIGWTTAGEWLEYSVDVKTAGVYDLALRVACNGTGRTLSVAMDGVSIANNVSIPNTGGWQTWQTVLVNDIALTPGQKIMRVTIGATDYINLNYYTFSLKKELKQEPFNGVALQIPGRIEAEEYDLGGEGLAYHEVNSNGNEGQAPFRDDEVDIEVTGDVDGNYNISYILQGEWLAYTVEVAGTGYYDLDLRVAADGTGKVFHIEMDGEDVTGPVSVPNTGGWQIWQTVTVKDVYLTSGKHNMRVVFDASYMNLNWLEFKDVITGTHNGIEAGIKVYPNPFGNEGLAINGMENYHYRITDLCGLEVEAGAGNGNQLVGKDLKSGVYVLTIKVGEKAITQKVLKY